MTDDDDFPDGRRSRWRIVPPALLGARRGQRLVERNMFVYRRTWMILLSGFFEPVFYLVSIRLGLGTLVGDVEVGGQTVSYAEFVAPALLATAAMNGALFDSTMNVFYKLKYARVYDAILATPLGVGDVAVGEIAWALLRGALYSTGFLVVMAAMGLAGSPWVLGCLPVAVLIGFAFAAVGLAGCSYARTLGRLHVVGGGHGPAVPVLGDLLPAVRLLAGRAVDRAGHAALPRGRAVPGVLVRPALVGPAHPRRLPGRDGSDRPARGSSRRLGVLLLT